MTHLAHNYGMSSHLIHKDGDGVAMSWERYQREPQQKKAVTMGHIARLTSDVCSLAKFRTARLLNACNKQKSFIKDVESRYQWLENSLKKAGAHFIKTEYSKAQQDD